MATKSKAKCCGTCEHWGTSGQRFSIRQCTDYHDSVLMTQRHHGTGCVDWKPKKLHARKPAPFKRWSVGGGKDPGDVQTLHCGDRMFWGNSPTQMHEVADLLTRARVVPPKGRR
jgi:hypothetical protein